MSFVFKKLIRTALHRFGYQLTPVSATTPKPPLASPAAPTPLRRFFAMLKRQGFSPKHIIDVGAHKGAWTRCAIDYFPDAHYTLIEPQAELRQHVQDLQGSGYKIDWLTAGAGDRPGVLEFTVNPRPDSSSFVPTQKQAESAGFSRIPIQVVTLNDVVRAHQALPDMVKIDAEGFDLKVIAGASDLLGTTDIFLLEATVAAQGYENTTAAVCATMSAAGYRLVDITDFNRSPKHDVLWLCELAFVRSGSSLLDKVTSYE